MGSFRALSVAQTNELDELLAVANSIIGTKTLVIKGNTKAATVVGTAIGGAAGAAIASGAGTAGIIGATAGLGGAGLGAAGFVGAGIAGVAALPIGIIVLIGMGIGFLFGKNNSKKKEKQRQANYVKEIVEKMEKFCESTKISKKSMSVRAKKKTILFVSRKKS